MKFRAFLPVCANKDNIFLLSCSKLIKKVILFDDGRVQHTNGHMTVILRGGWLLVHTRVSKRAEISIIEVEVIKINTNDEYDIHDCPLPMLMKRYVETKAVEVLGLHQKGQIFRLVSSISLQFFEN